MTYVPPPGYRVVRLVNRNHDYQIHEVYSDERDCLCVAKSVLPTRSGSTAVRDRLVEEARLLGELTHPHLVRAYELVERPAPTMIQEVLPGATLSHLVAVRKAGLSASDLALLGTQLCSVVGYLHRNDIVHLDLKTSNIIVAGGLLKLLDLGLAQPPGPAPAGQGTPEYLAPEQARGEPVSPATDVWGLGGVLYRAATRRRPFPEANDEHFPQLERPAHPIRRYRRNLPNALTELIESCLAPAPNDRPEVAEVTAALAEAGTTH